MHHIKLLQFGVRNARKILVNYSCSVINMGPSYRNVHNGVTNYETMNELKIKLAATMGVEFGYKPIPPNRSHLTQYIPKSQEELPKRSMADSFLVGLIPLSTDKVLQDKYITFLGSIRLGRLLEDMDIFAVMVAQKHILNPKLPDGIPSPQTLVTALVDEIDFSNYVPCPEEDIKISGHVSWVGKTSMEVVVWLEQMLHGSWHKITRALFLIAARDPTNVKSAVVNPLEPANEREKNILAGGETRKRQRMKVQSQHLSRVIPNEEEQIIIHNLYMKSVESNESSLTKRILPPNTEWMSNCNLSNVIFSHPEDRNLHNTVFGGFIMRHASELAFILGFRFSKYRPVLKNISDINFQKPIAVNSLIQMHAHVVFTQMQFMQIIVYVETYDPVNGSSATTNTFHFTYQVPEIVKQVVPLTYHEAMMYIDGRRHFQEVLRKDLLDANKSDVPELMHKL